MEFVNKYLLKKSIISQDEYLKTQSYIINS